MFPRIIRGLKSPLLIILLTAGLILSYNINKPFWGHHDWNGVYWGQVARNFARFGPSATNFAMFLDGGQELPQAPTYNFHYFPTLTLVWALFFKIFGVANWVPRLLAATFSLATIMLFFQLVKKYFSVKTAIIACLFWISTPMFIYFGKMPVHEIPLIFFVLAAIYFFLESNWRRFYLFSTLAMLTTWSGFFLVPVVTIFSVRNLRKIISLWFIAAALFGLHLLHDYFVTSDPFGGGLREVFLLRVGGVPLLPYISTLLRWIWTYYFLLIPLSLLGIMISKKRRILLLFLLYALFYPIIFRDAAFRHDYLLIYFWPFLALGSAVVVNRYSLALALVLLTFIFRFKFVLALENSDIYKDSVRFGQYIHDNSLPQDRILAATLDPTVPWDGWFIGYYADRNLVQAGADKTFTYSPGGKISIGADTKRNGTKYIPQ